MTLTVVTWLGTRLLLSRRCLTDVGALDDKVVELCNGGIGQGVNVELDLVVVLWVRQVEIGGQLPSSLHRS
jgi:hypothetical protein